MWAGHRLARSCLCPVSVTEAVRCPDWVLDWSYLDSPLARCTLCNCPCMIMHDVQCSSRHTSLLSVFAAHHNLPVQGRLRAPISCAASLLSHNPASHRSLQLATARLQAASPLTLEAAPMDPYAEGLLQLQVG